jgi:hypothetical protein
VEPGMFGDYLKAEKVWKSVHQRRQAEGKIIGWDLFRRAYPFGEHTAYDYMTVTRFKSGKELEEANNMTWDYITKGMSAADLAIADNTEKTRKLVNSELFKMVYQASGEAGTTRFMKLTRLQTAPGKGAELVKHEKMMQPVFKEAAKMGKISRWTFGSIVYPTSPETGNYYRVIGTQNLEDMLQAESNNYLQAAFKKVYPTKDYEAMMKTIRDLITILDSDLWEIVDRTE